MSDVQLAARHQEHVEGLCVAAIRALSGQRDLHFRAQRLHRGARILPLYAPHLHPRLDTDSFVSFRGAADGLALRLRWSDETLHRRLQPSDPLRRMLFDLLEQFRVESLAMEPADGSPARWPGVKHNLQHRFEAWTHAFHDGGLAETQRGLLLFTVAQISRARVCALPVPEFVEDLLEATRAGIGHKLGSGLSRLRRTRTDQAAYADAARDLADAVVRLLEEAEGSSADADGKVNTETDPDKTPAFGLLMEMDDRGEAESHGTVALGSSRVLSDSATGYGIYTTAYDQVQRPALHMRREQLNDFRQHLDRLVTAQHVNLPKLARALKALLSTPARDDWVHAQEEGLVDGRRLAQLIAVPTERRLFKQAQQEPQADAVVTLLIDCSGSMRQHIEPVAVLVDLLSHALDMAGVPHEVLGFTTGAWHGGRALRDWQRAGSPAHPGRVAETLHLVFKDANTAWRHARRDMAALLRPDLFREGVDGEALAWAADRLRTRSEPRKLLLAISDGCPMEGATQLANDAFYLDHHLQQVAGALELEGDITLGAIGVGLDLSPYYRRAHVLDLQASLAGRTVQEVVALIAQMLHRRAGVVI